MKVKKNIINETCVQKHGSAIDKMIVVLYRLESMARSYYNVGMNDSAEKVSVIIEELYEIKELFDKAFSDMFNTWYKENNEHSSTIMKSVLAMAEIATMEKKK